MKQITIISILLLAMLTAGRPCAYSQGQSDIKIKLSVELVVLDALVLNKRTGRAVGSLQRDAFALYEDGVRQHITHFSQDALPLSIIILIDTSSSVWPYINQMREGALEALEHLKPDDEVALMATAARTKLIQNFTKNKRLVAERIETLDETALGDDGILLHEAVYQAATHFRKASNPNCRRAIISITDDMSTQRLAFQGHSEKEAFDELYESDVVVCGLLTGDYVLKKTYKPKWYNPIGAINRKAARMRSLFGPGSILTYAKDTGGVTMAVEKGDVSARLAEIIIQLRSRYSFGYVSSNATLDGKFRKIQLVVSADIEKRERGIAILTRKGYYARVRPSAQ